MKLRITYLLLLLVWSSACRSCREPADPVRSSFDNDAARAAALPWRPWAAAAFEESAATGKPVFVSFDAFLCEWCRVLDRTTLSNDRVAELLAERFVLVRALADAEPALRNAFGSSLPQMAVFDAAGDLRWQADYLQPTQLNSALYGVLRDKGPALRSLRDRRYAPVPGLLSAALLEGMREHFFEMFEAEHLGYGNDARTLRIDDMRYDIFYGYLAKRDTFARVRAVSNLTSVWNHMRDAERGGFLTGSYNQTWLQRVPVKRAAEQAAMAALLAEVASVPRVADTFPGKAPALRQGAEQTVDFLVKTFVEDGRVFEGEIGSEEFYSGKPAAGSARPRRSSLRPVSVAAATAAGLARAGLLLGRDDWVATASLLLETAASDRTAQGLFVHLPETGSGADQLGDAAAVFEAALDLYTSTGKERWLELARSVAESMLALRDEAGYFLDVTTGVGGVALPGEIVPLLNARAAAAYWRLGVIDGDERWLRVAFKVATMFGGSPQLFAPSEGAFGLLVWAAGRPPLRIEVPDGWRSHDDVALVTRNPDPSNIIKWTDRPVGRLCVPAECSREYDGPEELSAAHSDYIRSRQLEQ